MKVAVISDIHGNWPAYQEVLADIERERPDLIYCAGDIVNPLLSSKEVWEDLQERKIPCLQGNHESYVIESFDGDPSSPVKHCVRFLPVRRVASHLGRQTAEEFKKLQTSVQIAGPRGEDLKICHASLRKNNRSHLQLTSDEIDQDLEGTRFSLLVSGHMHQPEEILWRGKRIVIAGSVGLPMEGKPLATYCLLTHGQKGWQAEHRRLRYDQEAALREFRESGVLAEGGPTAWLLYVEMLTAEKHLGDFMRTFTARGAWPTALEEWQMEARNYLERVGNWEKVSKHL